MNLPVRRLHDFFSNVIVAWLGSLASIIALLWMIADKTQLEAHTLFWWGSMILAFGLLLGVGIYSIKVRQENIQFRSFIRILHRINHEYRDALCSVFKNSSPNMNEDEFLQHVKQSERRMVKSVCEKIAKIYSLFTRRECIVTVKLITTLGNKAYCETYERSEVNCQRDAGQPRKFDINSGENTAFDRALMYAPGTVSHFHSADLDKEKGYRNQRDHWSDFYRCSIVVPIRSVDPTKIGSKECSHDMGFLSVDTLSERRLNDHWHVELLAAFADQMYNFLSLTRGKYALHRATSAAAAHPGAAARTPLS